MATVNKKAAFAASTAAMASFVIGMAVNQAEPWEGMVYRAYKDIAGIMTVCMGHTGPDIVIGKTYSDAECRALAFADMKRELDIVLTCSPHLLWHPIIAIAIGAWSYNLGGNRYCTSSLRIAFDKGDFEAGCDAMGLYTKARVNGVLTVVEGLRLRRYGDARRIGEIELCKASLTPQRWWAFRVKAGLV